jgi:hypothetical protein
MPGFCARTSCGSAASLAKQARKSNASLGCAPARESKAPGRVVVGIGKGILKVRPFAIDPPVPFLQRGAVGESPKAQGQPFTGSSRDGAVSRLYHEISSATESLPEAFFPP